MHLKVSDVLLWVVGGRLQGNNQSFKSERIGPRLSYSSTSSDRPQAHALPCLGVPTRLRGPRPTRRALYRLLDLSTSRLRRPTPCTISISLLSTWRECASCHLWFIWRFRPGVFALLDFWNEVKVNENVFIVEQAKLGIHEESVHQKSCQICVTVNGQVLTDKEGRLWSDNI